MDWRSKLIHPGAAAPPGFRSLVPPVYRGSTVLFENQASVRDEWRYERAGYSYGLYGTPTTLELGARIAELEGASHSFITPGGQASIALIYLAFCPTGTHVLLPSNAYGPHQELAAELRARFGIETQAYEPGTANRIGEIIRANTSLIWCESPGSVTMEVVDVAAIARAAHRRGVKVAMDNTYSAGLLFDAFGNGVDISMQALTKYVGGHSDLLLGTVSVRTAEDYEAVGSVHRLVGMAASPDDCSLALRGLQTLGVRLDRMQHSTLRVADWLQQQSYVARLLHPAFPSCPGHELWRRDFSGSASVFSVIIDPAIPQEVVIAALDSLGLFEAGYSWGGVTSLAVAYPDKQLPDQPGFLVRFNIGLEEPADLIADLGAAFDRFHDLP